MAKIIRIYDSHQKADDAVARLKEIGYTDQQIEVTTRQAEAAPPSAAEGSEATATPHTQAEQAVVTVDAPFGWAQTATETLDSFGPVSGETKPTVTSRATMRRETAAPTGTAGAVYEDPAPLSRALGIPVLKPFETTVRLMPDATPLSNKLGVRVLVNDTPNTALLPDDWSLSKALGLPTLSSDPAPLSTAIGRSVLIDDPAPLSRKAKWRTLLDDPTPLSSKLGWKTLTDRQ